MPQLCDLCLAATRAARPVLHIRALHSRLQTPDSKQSETQETLLMLSVEHYVSALPAAIPARMKAVLVGPDSSLTIGETDTPTPTGDQILVRVKASGVNRLDLLQRQGHYPVPFGESPILGVEVSGLVAQLGPDAPAKTDLVVGDRVYGLCLGGGYAEYALIPAGQAMHIPDALTYYEAAAIPEAFMTAYSALYWSAKLSEATKSVLIHAGASGVGLAAVQLANINKPDDRSIIVTAGTQDKIEHCQNYGATHGINYKSGPFADVVYGITNMQGVDVIVDFIGGPYFQQNVDCAAVDAKIILLGMLGGGEMDTGLGFNLGLILRKRLSVIGSTLRNRNPEYKTQLAKEFEHFSSPLFASGVLQPNVYKIVTMNRVEEAHDIVQRSENIGKVILTWQLKSGLTPASSIQNLDKL